MSLRALLEIVVHIESFRNIDLFFQGLYYLKVSLYNKKNDELYYANPYCVFTSKISQEKQRKLKSADHHHLLPSQILDDQSAFTSRSFLIRYCEEEVEINDIGLFRAEIDVEPEYLNTTFYMDIELFFSDLNALGGPEKWQQNIAEIESKAVFKSVSLQKFKINKLAQGISEFVPVIFEDQYYACANILVEATLLDFRFRVRQFKCIQSDIASFQERGILVKNKDGKEKQDLTGKLKHAKDDQEVLMTQIPSSDQNGQANGQWQFKPNNVAEFFFADETGEMPKELDMKEVDLLYNDYIRVMTCMHEKLRNQYNTYVTKFLDENQRKENGIEPETSRLILPGEDEDISKMFEQSKSAADDEEVKENGYQGGEGIIGGESQNHNSQHMNGEIDKRADEIGNESQYNIDETNESFSERKNQTNIPSLKNNKNAMNKSTKPFSERLLNGEMKIDPTDPYAVANQMIFEINLLAGKMLILQHKVIDVLKVCPRFITEHHHFEYKEKMRDKWGESIFRSVVPTSDFSIPSEDNIAETHKKFAKTRRGANLLYQENEQLKIEDQQMFGSQNIHPIIFEECYVKDDDPKFVHIVKNSPDLTEQKLMMMDPNAFDQQQNYIGVHLFVLVHGFQGNSCDMRLLKNNLSLMHPDAIFLQSSSNEEQTEGDIFEMGERLANEVKQYIQSFCPISCLARISFIGHSMGGLIIRASLPHLEEFKDKFYSYMSLSTPHLGYMYNSNKLFDAGMWVLKKWRKSKCLQQLSMTDAKNMEDTCIYKLSCAKGLQWFKNIALLSSHQDQYAPFDSARIQICKKANDDVKKGNLYIKMAQNLLGELQTKLLYRIDVNFKINDKNLDSFIGRTAHIQFLECQPLMKMIVYRYREFFS